MKSKLVLVTGGSEGLGKCIVNTLIKKRKYKVVVLANNSKVEKTEFFDYYCCDISDEKKVAKTINEIVLKYGKIDVLINNAGIISEKKFYEETYESIKRMIDINTTGTMFVTRAVIPHMIEKKKGHIINIVSQGGLLVSTIKPLYNTSKWAITGFTKCIEQDLLAYGIKVTGIYPSTIKTNIFAKNNIPNDLKRAIKPNDIAKIIEKIISDNSSLYVSDISMKFFKQQ